MKNLDNIISLLERPQIVVANKMDEENAEENLKAFKEKVGEDVKVSLFQQLFMKVLIKYYMLLQML